MYVPTYESHGLHIYGYNFKNAFKCTSFRFPVEISIRSIVFDVGR